MGLLRYGWCVNHSQFSISRSHIGSITPFARTGIALRLKPLKKPQFETSARRTPRGGSFPVVKPIENAYNRASHKDRLILRCCPLALRHATTPRIRVQVPASDNLFL